MRNTRDLSMPPVREVLANVLSMMWDDHDIRDG
jgi:hypothetical protein